MKPPRLPTLFCRLINLSLPKPSRDRESLRQLEVQRWWVW
jgi:hypothetical protein